MICPTTRRTRVCDVAIIVSLGRDLFEIPRAIQNLNRLIDRPVRLEGGGSGAGRPEAAEDPPPGSLSHIGSREATATAGRFIVPLS